MSGEATRSHDFGFPCLLCVSDEQQARGLKDEFMERAQIPYKGPAGKWEIWDHDKHCPKILEN